MASTATMTVPAIQHSAATTVLVDQAGPASTSFRISSPVSPSATQAASLLDYTATHPDHRLGSSHFQPQHGSSVHANGIADSAAHRTVSTSSTLLSSSPIDGNRSFAPVSGAKHPHPSAGLSVPSSTVVSPLTPLSPTSATRDGGVMISLERPDSSVLAASHLGASAAIPQGVAPNQHPSHAGQVHSATAPQAQDASAPRTRAEQHASARVRETKFGDYVLGRTLGEGEFGKVKMGWKREGSVQVAIKLVRRESIKGNARQLPKISREIAILRRLKHTHIVRLVEIVETERHIGIILGYASGGELFDYILKNRYLKEPNARRLFAQLISGVGYLHKNGIVHRDLKLENLLLDRNNNIIITDFGFANTFNPVDELSEELENKLSDREYVKSSGLDQVSATTGFRRGDLMQTSCGSPCYAAPELVVSDSLYTGRKVDVWSCGVILYAMLAGYLPFDDDPENPDSDNIHKLYQYIVSTPLTFPEWVTPHARDLLKRMLVPKPRERADLFEVARHSWLGPYAALLSSITSTSGSNGEPVTPSTQPDEIEGPGLARSASVREPSKKHGAIAPVGGLSSKHANVNPGSIDDQRKTTKEAKRRTLQIDYVPSQSSASQRDASASRAPERQSSARDRSGSSYSSRANSPPGRSGIPVRRNPTSGSGTPSRAGSVRTYRSPSVSRQESARPSPRASSNILINGQSKGQPAPPKVAADTAFGYINTPHSRAANLVLCGQPTSRANSQRRVGVLDAREKPPSAFMSAARGHKRSSTIGGAVDQPPVSARSSIFGSKEYTARPSSDSRRMSFAFSRRNSTAANAKPHDGTMTPGQSGATPAKSRHGSHRLSSFISSTTSLVRTLTGGGNKDSHIQSAAVSRAPSPNGSTPRRYSRPPLGSMGGRYAAYDGQNRSSIPVPKSQCSSHRNSIVSNYGPVMARQTITKVDEDPLDTDGNQNRYGDGPVDNGMADSGQAYYAAGMNGSSDVIPGGTHTHSSGSARPTGGSQSGHSAQGPARRMMDFFRKRNKRDSGVPMQE